MPLPFGPAYALSPQIVAANVGALGIVCLDAGAMGREFRLLSEPHGPALNMRAHRAVNGSIEWRADLPSGSDVPRVVEDLATPALIRIDVRGPIEEHAGYHDPCGGYSIGHDSICASLCAAFELGDVLLVIASPGSVVAGAEQNIARALAAKQKHGRRVTVYADEMICSGAYWWAAALGDEIFGPVRAQIGSIGARGMHASIAGALAKDGVAISFFTWPDDGKIAFAPELPLSEEARVRGERDIASVGEAFCAAILASPIGKRRGLTREMVVALKADVLTGAAAVDAGILDGVSTLEEVTSYALALAESGAGETAMPPIKAEGDAPDSEGGDDMKQAGACANCKTMNAAGAKFCNSCGTAMPHEGEEDDAPPPSSKPLATAPAVNAPKALPASASIASIVKASSDSPLAVKTAAIAMRHDLDRLMATVAGITGKASVDEQIGALLALPSKIERGEKAIKDLRAANAKAEADERAALCKRGVATGDPSMTAGKVYIPEVNAKGERTGTTIAPVFAEMKIGTLRAMVESLEANAPVRNPFKEDESAAKKAAEEKRAAMGGPPVLVNGEPTPEQIAAAVKDPIVQRIAAAPGNTHAIEKIARQFVIESARAVTMGA